MNLSKKIIPATILMISSSAAIAAVNTTDIEINVTKEAFVQFTGDLAGDVSKELTVAQMNGTVTNLGNLGTASNTVGSCKLGISSLNDFKLKHTVNNNLFLHGAYNNYSINYEGSSFTSGSNQAIVLASCNNAPSLMQIASPGFDSNQVQAGTYSDVLTVTVETE